jgi:hypothetical protein
MSLQHENDIQGHGLKIFFDIRGHDGQEDNRSSRSTRSSGLTAALGSLAVQEFDIHLRSDFRSSARRAANFELALRQRANHLPNPRKSMY